MGKQNINVRMVIYNTLCILYIICMPHTIQSMNTYTFKPELFERDVVPTEYMAYKQFTEHPLPYDVTYVAIPWTWLINNKRLHLITKNIHHLHAFTICQHIQYEAIIPILRQIGVSVLFTPHASQTKVYDGITVLPFPHYPLHTAPPAPEKNILYTFIGAPTHHMRTAFFKMSHPDNTLVCSRKGWHFWTAGINYASYTQEYKNALQQSRFAICLRGVGSSTIRFWEALGAGAIPILISDDMALPSEVNWDECIIRIPEKDILSIPLRIANINFEQEQRMRSNCLHAYTLFSGDNFTHTIRTYYDHLYKG